MDAERETTLGLDPKWDERGLIQAVAVDSASGAVLMNGSQTSSISNSLAFGKAEAVITTTAALNITGNLSGYGGLTKAGAYALS